MRRRKRIGLRNHTDVCGHAGRNLRRHPPLHLRQIVLVGTSPSLVRRRSSLARTPRPRSWLQLSEVRHMRHPFRVMSAIVFALACGTEHKAPDQGSVLPTAAQLEIRPSEVQLTTNDAQQFTLSPTTVQVTWSVAEANGGSITQAGLYTAPGYSGVFHVVATSTTNAAASAQAVVTVDSGVRIAATSPVNAYACEAVALTATVTGSADTSVVWSAPAACGTVTTAGVFTSLRGTGTCIVTAQAHADGGKMGAITVNVSPERVLSVAIVPASTSVL